MLTGNHAEADDLVQETLLRALRSLDGFGERSSLGTWLSSILINIHRSERRRAARRRVLLDEQPPPSESVGAAQEHRVELAETLAALDDLPEEQREAIALVALGGVTYAEAAEVLGVKLGTLMSRISRGRGAIRARIDGAGDRDAAGPMGETGWTRRRRG